jgi:hypothetical protein
MTENTPNRGPFETGIPDEVRRHFQVAHREMRAGIRELLPAGVFEHGRKARREALLAWRGIIDAALQRLEEKGDEA